MDVKELLKWGIIAVLALVALRWVRGFLSVGDDSSAAQYPGYPIGMVYPYTMPVTTPANGYWQSKRSRRSDQAPWRAAY